MAGVAHRLVHDIRETADMIVFKHTVFALPFAVISMVTAAGSGWPAPRTWGWVLLAMVGARTAAMAFNRLADQTSDALNPRTSRRALPAGRISRRFAWAVTACGAACFLLAASQLNRLCLLLAPPTLAVLLGYSLAKRFTPLAHLWLGAALGLAPVGAWIAVTADLAVPPLVLAGSVALWVAGFDIIYSMQDEHFDRSRGLRSVPEWLGGAHALAVSRVLHVIALGGFAAFALLAGGGWIRLAAVLAAAVLLIHQHRLVSADDLSSVDAAFFTANGLLSVVMSLLFLFAKMQPAL